MKSHTPTAKSSQGRNTLRPWPDQWSDLRCGQGRNVLLPWPDRKSGQECNALHPWPSQWSDQGRSVMRPWPDQRSGQGHCAASLAVPAVPYTCLSSCAKPCRYDPTLSSFVCNFGSQGRKKKTQVRTKCNVENCPSNAVGRTCIVQCTRPTQHWADNSQRYTWS